MISQLLRRFSVRHRIAAVLMLLILTLLISVPLIVINQKTLVGRLNEVTEGETKSERHLLMASVRIVESRVNLDLFIDGFEPSTEKSQRDVLLAIDHVEEARSLTREPNQNKAMSNLLEDLSDYHGLISTIDNSANTPNSSVTIPARIFALNQSLAHRVELIAKTSRQRVVEVNETVKVEAQERLTNLFFSYGLLLLACIILIMLIGRSITRPIADLHQWALDFHRGETNTSLPVMGRDELTHLAQILNKLATTLSSSHVDLEQKVVESSNQISATRAQLEEEAIFRRQVQQELAEREYQFGAIFEYASDGILIAQNGRMRYVNPRFAEIFGYAADSLIGTLFEEYVITNDRPLLQEREHQDYGSETRSNRFEVSAVHYSGELIELELNSGIIDYEGATAVLWIARDVTARKQSEQRLEVTQYSVEYAGDAIYWILPTGQIEYANQVACQWLGRTADEIRDMTFYDVLPRLSEKNWHAHWERIRKAGQLIFESQHLTKNGETFPAEVRTTYSEFDGQAYVFSYVQDISQRKESEENLRKAKEGAIAANEAKSRFLSNVTHELRTPMNGVLGMTSLLNDTPLNSEQREIVNTIRTSGDTLLSIINEVLDFSKLDADKIELEMTQFDLIQGIEETIDLVSVAAAKKGISLLYLFEDSAPRWIIQDVTRVRQILANLLSNAVKFTDDGEIVITISAEPITEPTMIAAAEALGFAKDAELPQENSNSLSNAMLKTRPLKITFAVKDTGMGIPADRTDRLFQSFTQIDASTSRRFGGTGLGLAISKRLAEAMGGTMWVESEENVGSTFYFSIIATGESASGVFRTLEEISLHNKTFAVCVKSMNMQRAIVQYLNSWQTESTIIDSLGDELADGLMADALILDRATFEEAKADEPLYQQLGQTPVVLLASMIKPKATSEGISNITQLSMPVRASQLQDALVTAINKGMPLELTPLSATPSPKMSAKFHHSSSRSAPKADRIAGHRRPLKILLAEDNLVNQKVALGILRKLGYHAEVAANGQEVLDALAREPYDLILMDISMPTMDGITATEKIRSEIAPDKQPYIIAVTANAMPGDREKYIEIGMNDYVSKPIQIKVLQKSIDQFKEGAESTEPARLLSTE